MKADKLDFLANKSLSELKALAGELKLEPNGDRRLKSTWFDLSIEYRCPGIKKRAAKLRDLARAERLRVLLEEERHSTIAIGENSPGADLVQEPIEKSLDVSRARFAFRVTYRKSPRCRSRPLCLSSYLPKNSPVSHAPWSLSKNPPMSMPPSGDRIRRAGICTRIASARLRAPNQKLLELARSQSEVIGKAKDISPVEKPSLCRVLKLALAACLDVS
jgi:hypothetical protein